MCESKKDKNDCRDLSRRGFLGNSSKLILKSAAASMLLAEIANVRQSVAQTKTSSPPQSEDQFAQLANEYSLSDQINYLNHASIGTVPTPVQKAHFRYLELCESNPWLHIWGGQWEEPLQEVRRQTAELLGCDMDEVALTHNTTEMFNTLSLGLPLRENEEVLFSTLCHSGASIPFLERAKLGKYQARRFEFPLHQLPNISTDQIVDAYIAQIRPQTKVLVIPHLDNTVGIRYPITEISSMAKDKGVDFVAVDAAQTVGMIPIDCRNSKIDVLATSGHKWINGPKGTGAAYIGRELHEQLQPMSVTWGQSGWSTTARKYEDYGTRDLPEVLALGDAINFHQQLSASDRERRLNELWAYTRSLVDERETLQWNSPNDWTLGGSVYSIKVQKPAAKLARDLFANDGIVVRPFTNLGLNNIRVSPNVFSSKLQIRKLIERIA